MKIATYAEYKKHIRSLIVEYGRKGIIAGATPVLFMPAQGIPADEGGVIQATDPSLKFKDGASIRILEVARVMNGNVELMRYTYHYERPNGYFFRYEREETTDPVRKPEYHCHVILNLPHFIAPPVHLEAILNMIAANFYSPDTYQKQIIGQEIRLTV